jgi:hypothetical protein
MLDLKPYCMGHSILAHFTHPAGKEKYMHEVN